MNEGKFGVSRMCNCCQYGFGICRIVCYMFCCKSCQEKPVVKEEFSFLALGLDGAGKSTLISKLCGEIAEEIEPTSGFSVKDISLSSAILHVKEVGGSEKTRRYWHHYYKGAEGLIFVVDGSASDEKIELAKSELKTCLSHSELKSVPLLCLVSKMDSSNAGGMQELSEKLDVPKLCDSRSFIVASYDLEDVTHLKSLLERFSSLTNQSEDGLQNL